MIELLAIAAVIAIVIGGGLLLYAVFLAATLLAIVGVMLLTGLCWLINVALQVFCLPLSLVRSLRR